MKVFAISKRLDPLGIWGPQRPEMDLLVFYLIPRLGQNLGWFFVWFVADLKQRKFSSEILWTLPSILFRTLWVRRGLGVKNRCAGGFQNLVGPSKVGGRNLLDWNREYHKYVSAIKLLGTSPYGPISAGVPATLCVPDTPLNRSFYWNWCIWDPK